MTSRGREVLAGGLVGLLGEAADQLLEDVAHLVVGDVGRGLAVRSLDDAAVRVALVGVEVDLDEAPRHQEQEVGVVEPGDLGLEAEALHDVAHVLREAVEEAHQVGGDVVGVGEQLGEVEAAGVVEAAARGLHQHPLAQGLGQVAGLFVRRPHRLAGEGEHLVQPAQEDEGQDHPPVLGLLVVPAQQVGHAPDEADLLGEVVHGMGGCPWALLPSGFVARYAEDVRPVPMFRRFARGESARTCTRQTRRAPSGLPTRPIARTPRRRLLPPKLPQGADPRAVILARTAEPALGPTPGALFGRRRRGRSSATRNRLIAHCWRSSRARSESRTPGTRPSSGTGC